MDSTWAQSKSSQESTFSQASNDDFFGVIAINEKCDGYVSMYKKGEQTNQGSKVPGLDSKNRVTGKAKEKKDHIKKLMHTIKKDGLFMHSGASVKMKELVVATCGDYGDELEILSIYSLAKPHFVHLPPDSKDPIADAIQAKDEFIQKSMAGPGKIYQASAIQPDPAKEDCSAREESLAKKMMEKDPGTSKRDLRDSTQPDTSNTHILGTSQGSVVRAAMNKLEGDSQTGPIASNISSRMAQESGSIGSTHSEDSGNSEIQPKNSKRNISESSITSKQGEQVPNARDQMLIKAMEAMEARIITKISGLLDEKLDKIMKGQEGLSTAKGRDPQTPGVAVGYIQYLEPTPCLLYNLHHAPSKVCKIEQQFFDRLEKKLSSENKQLQEDITGPSVVFVINSSRIQADIQRDLKSVTFTGPTLLMIIKPMREPDRTPPRLLADDLAGFPVDGRDCHYLLVDNNNTALHDCDVNSDTVDAVARFIAKNQSAKK